ncbi:type IV pilus modification PilV family protein [Geodermatophilus sp. SYSU D00684]
MSISTDDRGETLLEILIATVILGITAVAVLSGLMTTVTVSDTHRKQATAGAAVKDYAESLSRHVAASDAHYAECAAAGASSPYQPVSVGYAAPAGYSASVSAVQYWNPTSRTFTAGCSSAGMERVTLQVSSSDGRATERLVIVVRKACGAGSAC